MARHGHATLGGLVIRLGSKAGGKQLSLVDRTSASVAVGPVPSTESEGATREPRLDGTRPRRWSASPDGRFWLGVLAAAGLGAVVRLIYLFHGAPALVLGDGFDYHQSAHRLADGLGYTAALGDVGAEYAHHPPGWVTLLAGMTELGGGSMRAHQVTGLAIGVCVIAVAGLVGRRYAGSGIGVIAAFIAAVYPGFWVLDVQILSEPLGLLVLGLLMLMLADLWERPTLGRAILAGAILGALALVRSEQVALLAIAVAPILVLNRRLSVKQRLAWTSAATLAALVMIAPWTIHNLGRFEEPVVLSSNFGGTLLAGNCPPKTYGGEFLGSFDIACNFRVAAQNPEFDASQMDIEARRVAWDNINDNIDRLPVTVMARYGRTIGIFRPEQTVNIDAHWLGSAAWPVWAWVTSFWLILPLAAYGGVLLRRSRRFQWPLVAPVLIVLFALTISIGDPRYHTMADLGLVVLAAVAINHLVHLTLADRRRRA
jgi:4-amino-4-deoxy-L-arabinose transferase-like glycosyltransferase